ncbi:MAG: filamentous hemagglutinin N-terminal domain-containing protein [Sedimenticola sp.]
MKKCTQKGIAATRLIRKALALFAGAVIGMSGPAYSGPEGGQVMGGSGHISLPDAATTLIQQQSQNLAIDWQRFNVDSNERVLFQQPSASAAVLNRILDQNPSQIFGSIEANGRVFLSNPNGIIFGASATVNVGSLLATGLDMSSADFMDGRYEMGLADGESAGVVINRGIISAATGGSVTLVGGAVSNEGLIIADVGYVNLAAGRKAVVDFRGDGSIRFQVDEAVLDNPVGLDSAVNNSGEIRAEGGQVLLSGNAAQDVFTRVVNNDGVIRAGRIDDSGGTIRLVGSGGDVYNSGTLDASSGNGQGGDIDVLGDRVAIIGDALIDASGSTGGGNVRIGGDYQGANPDVQNASHTVVSSNAVIEADATDTGNGGRVIVWADELTKFHGSISARGGENGGEGGFVETSGHILETAGAVVRADTWLLDPTDVTVSNSASAGGTFDSGDPDTWTPTASGSNVQVSDITTALGNGTNVTITTAYVPATNEAGDITVQSDILVADLGAEVTLRFEADGDFTTNNNVDIKATGTGSGLNVEIVANDDGLTTGGKAGGAVSIGGDIETLGGDFSSTGTSTFATGDADSIVTAGGNVTINHGGTVSFGDPVNAGAGAVALTAGGDITQASDAVITAASLAVSNTSGATTLDANNAVSALNAITATGGNFELVNTVALQLNDAINAGSNSATIDNGSNAVTFALDGSTENITASTLTVTAQDVDALNTINSLGSTNVVLQPDGASDTLGLAVTDGTEFTLTTDDVAELKAGSGSVTIGQSGGTGAFTLGAAVDLAGRTVTLRGGRLNDGTNTISADSLTLDLDSDGAGANTLKTTVATLIIDSTDGNDATDRAVTVTETDGVVLGTVNLNDGDFSLTAAGTVTQSGALTVDELSVSNTGGATTLDNASNNVDDLNAVTATGGHFELVNTGSTNTLQLNDAINASTNNVTINTGSEAVTFALDNSSEDVTAGTLTITAQDVNDLNTIKDLGTTNVVLQPDGADDSIRLGDTDTTAFSLTTDDIAELNAGTGSVTIGQTSGTGAFDLRADVTLASQALTLRGGRINDSTDTITADSLTLDLDSNGAGANTLKTNVATLVIDTTDGNDASDRSVTITETDGVVLGIVNLTDGDFSLTAAGAVTQTGALTANELTVSNTGGATTLDNASNDVDELNEITVTGGHFTLVNTDALQLNDAVDAGSYDVTINNGSNALTFALTGSEDVTAGTLTVTAQDVDGLNTIDSLDATNVVLQPDGASDTLGLAVTDGTEFTLTTDDIAELKAGSDSVTIGQSGGTGAFTLGAAVDLAGDTVTLRGGRINDSTNTISADSLTLDLDSNGAGANTLKTTVASLSINSSDGNDATDQSVTVTETDGGVLGIVNVGSGGFSLTAPGAVTQSGALTAGSLTVTNTGGVTTLDNGSNAVGALNAINATGGDFELTNTVALQLNGAVNAGSNSVTIDNGNSAVTFALDGATENVTASTLTITAQDVDGLNTIFGLGSTNVVLQPDGADDTLGLAVTDGTEFTLTANDIAELKAGTGSVTIGQSGGTGAFTLGAAVDLAGRTVTLRGGRINDSTNAISADSLTLDLDPDGDGASTLKTTVATLNINSSDGNDATDRSVTVVETDGVAIALANVGSGNFNLTAAGAVTQSDAITAAGLSVTNTTGTTTLTDTGNDVDSLSASAAGQTFSYTDTDGVDVGAGGITATTLNLTAGNDITDTGALDIAGTATFTTTANDGSVDLGSASDIDGALSITTDGSGTASVTNLTGGIELGTVTTAALTVSAAGDITDSGVLTIGGTSSFTTTTGSNGSIALDSASSYTGAVSLSTDGSGTTSVTGLAGDIALGAVDTTALTITTDGSITDSGEVNASGVATFTAGDGEDILLGTTTNTFLGTVALASAGTLNDVTLYDDTAFALSALSIAGDLTVTTEGTLAIDGAQTTTGGDIRLVATGNVTQSANITAESGSAKLFSDSGTITMADNTVTSAGANTNDRAIVYTASGDVTIAVLETRNTGLTVEVTSQTGNVIGTADAAGHPLETANITGASDTTANIHALATDKNIGAEPLPLRFDNSAVSAINYGLDGGTLYHSGESGNQLAIPPITLTDYSLGFRYEQSDGSTPLVVLGGGSIVDVPGLILSGASGAAAAAESAFLNMDASLLKKRTKIYNIVGQGLLLPKHQLDDDDDDEEDELELEEEEEGGLTYLFQHLPLMLEQ